jgi:hypothetical protein
MADMNDLVAYIREGNEQAVKYAGFRESDWLRWAGKSHAYLDVLAFIENEMGVDYTGPAETVPLRLSALQKETP